MTSRASQDPLVVVSVKLRSSLVEDIQRYLPEGIGVGGWVREAAIERMHRLQVPHTPPAQQSLLADTPADRLRKIAELLEAVDNRCIAVDGPVTPTLDEMTDQELRQIYRLANVAAPR